MDVQSLGIADSASNCYKLGQRSLFYHANSLQNETGKGPKIRGENKSNIRSNFDLLNATTEASDPHHEPKNS